MHSFTYMTLYSRRRQGSCSQQNTKSLYPI